jgi:hypothetical protein
VYANGSATGSGGSRATVDGKATVNGNVSNLHIAGVLELPDGATITNVLSAGETRMPIEARDPCPCDLNQLIDVRGIAEFGATQNDNANPDFTLDENLYATGNTSAGSTLVLPCGRYYLREIVQGRRIALHATGRTVLFIGGNVTVNGLSIVTDDGAEIDLFIGGNLTTTASSSLGQKAQPAAVRTYVEGLVSFQGKTELGGNLYAPRATVSFGAAGEVFGSVFVNQLSLNANTRIHFDSAIRSAGGTCEQPPPADGGPPCTPGLCPSDPVCGGVACLEVGPGVGVCAPCTNNEDCCNGTPSFETCLSNGFCEDD